MVGGRQIRPLSPIGQARAAHNCVEKCRYPRSYRIYEMIGVTMLEILRERVYRLSLRVSGLGIGADVYALSLPELRGLYRFLLRIVGER